MQSNLLLTEPIVVDAKTANGQDKFQMFQELLVSTDHLQYAMIAHKDNLLINIHARHAQLDKSNKSITQEHAILQDVPVNMLLEPLLITSTVEDARLALGHHKFQMPEEMLVSLDHSLPAQVATKDSQMMDTHVLPAQLETSRIQTIQDNVTDQFAMDNMISNSQSMLKLVEDAKPANGQDKFQTSVELLVLSDHLLTAQIAFKEDQMITTLVNNAQQAKLKTQELQTDVSLPTAPVDIKSNFHMTQDHAEDVTLANGHNLLLINSRLLVLKDQRLHAVADKNNQLMDTHVKTAQLELSKVPPTRRFVSDHHAQDNTKSNLLSMKLAVVLVKLANGHNLCQTLREHNACKDH